MIDLIDNNNYNWLITLAAILIMFISISQGFWATKRRAVCPDVKFYHTQIPYSDH